MGRFFDAMQRAARPTKPEQKAGDSEAVELPDLDEALLQPEAESEDVFGLTRDLAAGSDSPSAVIRTLESEIRKTRSRHVRSPQLPPIEIPAAEPSGVIVAPRGQVAPTVSEPPEPNEDTASSLRNRPISVLREPDPTAVRVHPAYDGIVQRLITFRRSPRQSVILVAGSVAGEGTSTVARNVATALSHPGTERVLLLDANLRTPSQHRSFFVDRGPGLSDILRQEVPLAPVIHDDVGSGISLITSGSPVKSPTQVLKAMAVQSVVMALLSLFDWIVIDSPPATSYPDVSGIASACGGAMLVVRAETTRQEVAQAAMAVLQNAGVEVLGAVLNRRQYHIPGFIYRYL